MSYGFPSIGLYSGISIILFLDILKSQKKMMYVPMECRFTIYSLLLDIHNLSKDIHNVFMDILNSFMDYPTIIKDTSN